MKKHLNLFAMAALLVGASIQLHSQGSQFTYQGRLNDGPSPANGSYDLKFTLFDTNSGGAIVAGPVTLVPGVVTNGLFTVTLDFGSVFDGSARWLEIGVRTNGGGAFTSLTPRQPLTPAPYALYATNAGLAALASGVAPLAVTAAGLADGAVTSAKILDGTIVNADVSAAAGIADTKLATIATAGKVANSATTATSATTANAIVARDGAGNFSAGTITAAAFSGNGASLTSLNAAQLGSGTVTGTLNFSPPSGPPFSVGNQNLVSGLNADFLDGWQGSHYWQLGGNSGVGSGDFLGTTENQPLEFRVNGERALRLEPGGVGEPNVIGGSMLNLVATGRVAVTIGGGGDNTAHADYSTIGGGYSNCVAGNMATVPGGRRNLAGGTVSFAAGNRAKTTATGAFVWGDSQDYDVWAGGDNQFVARATGGFYFFTAVNLADGFPTAGVQLHAGDPGWQNWCDRAAKQNFRAVDTRALLDKLCQISLTEWNMKAQSPSVRHLGPMAQDFHAAFGLGDSDKTITTVDADGVALAAIQGLNQKVEEQLKAKNAEIEELKLRLATLEMLILKNNRN